MEAGSNSNQEEEARLNHFIKSLKNLQSFSIYSLFIIVKKISLGTTGDFTHLYESFNPISQMSIAHFSIISYFVIMY